MTNEEAIKVIEKYIKIESFDRAEAFGMAVRALSNSDEDCINREYILSKAHCCCDDLADDEPCCVDVDDIKNAPSVQPTAKENLVIEDCISRKQAMKACYQMAVRTGIEEMPYKYAETELAHLPSVQPKQKSDVLDKIRAEIAHLHDWAFSREGILRIIDKYKAESEE